LIIVRSGATLLRLTEPRKRELRSWGLPKRRKFARDAHQERKYLARRVIRGSRKTVVLLNTNRADGDF
jgi:hypothetical protein